MEFTSDFEKGTSIKTILGLDNDERIGQIYQVMGSLTSFKYQKAKDFYRFFMHISDGSTSKTLQVYYHTQKGIISEDKLSELSEDGGAGISISVIGEIIHSKGKGQDIELALFDFTVISKIRDRDTYRYGASVGKKKSAEQWHAELTSIRHDEYDRFRHPIIQATMRIRGCLKAGLYAFFCQQGFIQIDTPILTESDCEGAGEMFQVTTLDLESLPLTEDGHVDYSGDFFKKLSNMTVSGQLEAEALAQRLGKVWTFGPTFRAENSMTSRHLAEFWMLEPEMVFDDLDPETHLETLICLEEDMLRFIIEYVLIHSSDDIKFLDSTVSPGLIEQLMFLKATRYERVTYTSGIEILQQAVTDGHRFEESYIEFGMDLASDQERYLVKHFGGPIFLTSYPQDLKSFYMKSDLDCEEGMETVKAVDFLVPGIGELCGGSVREDDPEKLILMMEKKGVPIDELSWYIDLRHDGGKPTGGFGLGFERLIRLITGLKNIRDVIAYPRYPGHL